MSDHVSEKEFELALVSLKDSNIEIKSLIDAKELQAKLRRITLKLSKKIEIVDKFKPQKRKADVHNFADSAVHILFQARLYLAELPAILDPEDEDKPKETKQSKVMFVPRNLEVRFQSSMEIMRTIPHS